MDKQPLLDKRDGKLAISLVRQPVEPSENVYEKHLCLTSKDLFAGMNRFLTLVSCVSVQMAVLIRQRSADQLIPSQYQSKLGSIHSSLFSFPFNTLPVGYDPLNELKKNASVTIERPATTH